MTKAFVGRQPIFGSNLEVDGYELLFRSGEKSFADIKDGDVATANVLISAFADIGLDTLVGPKRAFVNLTRNLLVDGNLSCLPPDRLVLEILEDIPVDEETIAAITSLREQGFTIALDDFIFSPDLIPLIGLADIIKVEYPAIERDELPSHVEQIRALGDVKLLAEKVETQEDYELCKELGFDLFQGYFFCKPQVVSEKTMQSNVAAIIRVVNELQRPDISAARAESILQTDANLCYRLLRFVNSVNSATTKEIESVRQAAVLMGIGRIRSLASMMLLSAVDDSKPRELIQVAMTRAKMCELLAEAAAESDADRFYTLGLFSVLDALLDQPMEEVVNKLPLSDEMRSALVERTGRLGEVLSTVIDYEQGQCDSPDQPEASLAFEKTLRWMASAESRVAGNESEAASS